MGQCTQKQGKMTNRNLSGDIPGPKLIVHFYGLHSFKTAPLSVSLEHPVICEDVCIQCVEHLSASLGRFFHNESERTIGPMLLPMLGLYASDHTLKHWVPDGHLFDSSDNNQEFYLRVRVRPVIDKIASTGIFVDYLFWQCAEDFMTGRVWELYDKNIQITNIRSINENAIGVLFGSANYQLQNIAVCDLYKPLEYLTKCQYLCQKVTCFNLERHLPAKTTKELRKEYNIRTDPIMRVLAQNSLRDIIKKFFQTLRGHSLSSIRTNFIMNLMGTYVPMYGLESFPAQQVVETGKTVELIIRTLQDGFRPGLYFYKKWIASLEDIVSVSIIDCDSNRTDQKCQMELDIKHCPPLMLLMDDHKVAMSFISSLDTYCRLKVNYHTTVISEPLVMAPSLQVLKMLKSFGPIEEDEARQYVEQLNDSQEGGERFYIIYQDCLAFRRLHALGVHSDGSGLVNYNICYEAAPSECGFTFTVTGPEHPKQTFRTHQQLFCHLNVDLSLGRRSVPREEICGAMHFLKEDGQPSLYSSSIYYSEVDRHSRQQQDGTSDRPIIYREDEVVVKQDNLIARGEFSDVYRFMQMEYGREAILKKVTNKNRKVEEAYKKGMDRLMKLGNKHRFFVAVYGQTSLSPLRIIYECMPGRLGSLLSRLQDQSRLSLNLLQVASVLHQLADCLCYLEESGLIYGSMRCSKILVYSEKNTGLNIRLGDPSISIFCDDLPVTDIQNVKRLAWVAPERFGALSTHTVATEVYSFGTTLWEIVNKGKDPQDSLPGHSNMLQFFRGGNRLPDPLFCRATPAHGRMAQKTAAREESCSAGAMATTEAVDLYTKICKAAEGDSGETSSMQQADQAVETAPLSLQTGPSQPEAVASPHAVKVTDLENMLLKMMHSCWDTDPKLRPLPLELLKDTVHMERQANIATKGNPLWELNMLLEVAVQTGQVRDKAEAQNLQKLLDKQRKQAQLDEEREQQREINNLAEKVRRCVNGVIASDRLDFSQTEQLGRGNFGEVMKATLKPAFESREEERANDQAGEVVAVKKLLKHSTRDTLDFLKEALRVSALENPYVVRLIGVVMPQMSLSTEEASYQLVMEFADRGNLKKYVSDNAHRLGTLQFKAELQKLACDVAKGMEYMCQEKKVIHGDLAARNVLLFSGSPLTAKMGDFGLSHQVTKGPSGTYYYSIDNTKERLFPIYGMPIELLRLIQMESQGGLKLSIKTDVWSYGVVLWEMFSNSTPESDIFDANTKHRIYRKEVKAVSALLEKYERGERLKKPANCPKLMYLIMKKCWKEKSSDRPTFRDLHRMVEELTEWELQQE